MSVDTTELLRILKNDPIQMLSRSYLNRQGISDEVIEEADRNGEVVVPSGDGPLASVFLTVDGEKALSKREAI